MSIWSGMERKSINRYHSYCKSLDNLAEAKEKDSSDKFILSVRTYEDDELFVCDFQVEVFNCFETIWVCFVNML